VDGGCHGRSASGIFGLPKALDGANLRSDQVTGDFWGISAKTEPSDGCSCKKAGKRKNGLDQLYH